MSHVVVFKHTSVIRRGRGRKPLHDKKVKSIKVYSVAGL